MKKKNENITRPALKTPIFNLWPSKVQMKPKPSKDDVKVCFLVATATIQKTREIMASVDRSLRISKDRFGSFGVVVMDSGAFAEAKK